MDEHEIIIDETMSLTLSAIAEAINDAEDNALLLAEIGQINPDEFRLFLEDIGEVDNENARELLEAAELLHLPSSTLGRLLESHRRQQISGRPQRQFPPRSQYFSIIGASPQMQQLYETVERVAETDASVLIVGEPGTGKELIANAIHHYSGRAGRPFVNVNCAALPEALLESELFGHTEGAFTGARADKDGLIQHAEGGSLLIKEITEMPVAFQPKLLRVLQERGYRKVGSEKTYPADFRLICSTSRPPADAVRDGLLRDDLFYRVSTVTIHVPPLRERLDDIYLLAEHFLQTYARRHRRPINSISQSAYQYLFSYTWPGNVRELEYVLERAVLLASGNKIEPGDLPFDSSVHSKNSAGADYDVLGNATLVKIEKLLIEHILQHTGGNEKAAAELLGMHQPHLYSKIKKYNIEVKNIIPPPLYKW